MLEALKENRCDYVRVLLDKGVNLKKKSLPELYAQVNCQYDNYPIIVAWWHTSAITYQIIMLTCQIFMLTCSINAIHFSNYVDLTNRYVHLSKKLCRLSDSDVDLSDIKLTSSWQLVAFTEYESKIFSYQLC